MIALTVDDFLGMLSWLEALTVAERTALLDAIEDGLHLGRLAYEDIIELHAIGQGPFLVYRLHLPYHDVPSHAGEGPST